MSLIELNCEKKHSGRKSGEETVHVVQLKSSDITLALAEDKCVQIRLWDWDQSAKKGIQRWAGRTQGRENNQSNRAEKSARELLMQWSTKAHTGYMKPSQTLMICAKIHGCFTLIHALSMANNLYPLSWIYSDSMKWKMPQVHSVNGSQNSQIL